MADTYFGKGIKVASGFDLNAKSPLDTRLVVQDLEELEQHTINNRAYEGMIVYIIKEKMTYQFVDGVWVIFGGQDVSNGSTSVIIDNLNSLLTNASLSANQGRILREMIEALQGNYYTIEEIEAIKITLENKDLEIEDKFNNISDYFPRKLSEFENDMKYLTEENLEETLRHITIPVKTSQLENDAGYITQENIEENVVSKIPIKTSQLENDANYITQENIEGNVLPLIPTKITELENDANYITQGNILPLIPTKVTELENDASYITQEKLDEILKDFNPDTGGNIGGDGYLYIGDKEPNKKYLWIDTSTPSNLTVVNYDERVKLKYIEMLNLTKVRLSNLGSKLDLIERNINKISSDNADKISIFKSTLGSVKSQISVLILQIENLISKETIEKEESKELRKQSKTLLYSLSDFNDEVMRVLDNELKLDISGGDSDDNDDIQTDGASLLTEDGFVLLTEDGLMLLADGVATSTILADAILTELGLAILTEDGKQILKG